MKNSPEAPRLLFGFQGACFRLHIIAILICLVACLVGCSKSDAPPMPVTTGNPSPSAVTAPILAAWQSGDQSVAVRAFLEADWVSRPLFEPIEMTLTEEEYAARYEASPASSRVASERDSDAIMQRTIGDLKEVTAAVVQAGRDALVEGDVAQARAYFNSLNDCGTALADSKHLIFIQLFGKSFKELSEAEMAKIAE